MVDRMIPMDWWQPYERYLSYRDSARIARERADNPLTSIGDRRILLEREAHWTLLANEYQKKAKNAEPR